MNKIFADAEEKFVKTVVLYGKSADNYLYTDEDCTEANRVDKDTLMNMCLKGSTICYDETYYTPVSFKEDSGHVAVTIATNIATSASTSVTLYSKEYSAD